MRDGTEPKQRRLQVPAPAAVPLPVPGNKVIVLENNFDRLSVHSVTAEISVDEDVEWSDSDEEGMGRGEGAERLRARPAIGQKCGGRPRYTEAVGDARLAWRWVEGWRSRLRKGGDVVEKARWEWRLESQMRAPNTVPVVVVKEPEAAGGA
jgi:hypothetical protein